MADRLFVSTRKGLFVFQRAGGSWRIAETQFPGEPVTAVLPDARDGTLYAALNLGHFGVKLRRRRPGREWEECSAPAYPPRPEPGPGEEPGAPWTLLQVWCLEAGGADRPGTLWAGTIPGGLFRSRDGGDTWKLLRSLWDRPERSEWFGGGYDHPGIHSVCVDPRDSRSVTVAVSCGGVWQSRDDGEDWRLRAEGMDAAYMPPERRDDPNIQDPHRVVQCAARPEALWAQHHCGIFRTTDYGARWVPVGPVPPSGFGFAAAVHPADPDTAWFVPAQSDDCRVPPDARLVVTRTRDGGNSFEVLRRGLPEAPSYDLVYRHGLDVDAEGRCLAMGSTTGGLWISDDQGEHWQQAQVRLPPVYAVRFAAG